MIDINRKLISHGGVYLLGNVLQRAVSFVMLPIYTRYLTPADYGTLELLTMVIDVVSIVLGLRISQAIFRFYQDYETAEEKFDVIATAMILMVGFNLIGIGGIAAFGTPLSQLVFSHPDAVWLLIVFSFTLLFHAFIEVPMVFIRARQKPLLFVSFSTLKLLLQLSLNIYFVVFLGMRIEGVIYSAVITGVIISGILAFYTITITGLKFSPAAAKQMISFSLPLMVTGLISFFVTFGDRYFLRFYGSLAGVGIYSLAYKFGFLVMFTVVQPFSNYWDSEKYQIMNRPDAGQVYRQTFLIYSTAVTFFVVFVSIFVEDLLRIMSDPSFWPAADIAPVIMLAYIFNAWANYTNLGIFASNRTVQITYGTTVGAVVVAAGYVLLIPPFGPMGAAWATVLGFSARFLWITWRAQQLYHIDLPWKQVLSILSLGLAAYLASGLGPANLVPSIVYDLLVAAVFVAAVFLLPILPQPWRRRFSDSIQRPWKIPVKLRNAGSGNSR